MNREQILMGIDNMKNLREKDYATIDFLLKNTSPRLFTKIIEEVLLGNLYISDFESLLSDSQREKYNAIIQQEYELVDYMAKLTAFRHKIHQETIEYENTKNDGNNYEISVYISNETYNATDEYKSFIKDNILLSLFESDTSENAILKEIKFELYKKIYEENATALKNAIIIAPNQDNDILIPISYHKVILDDFDIEYMKEHNMSEEEMRKMKSMMLFLSNKYSQEGENDESN